MRNRNAPSIKQFGELLSKDEAQTPILAPPVRSALMEWLQEIWAAKALEEVGLKPRKKAIFHGAPGTGKTTLAHHLAARLGMDMLVVRPEFIIDAYVGSSARNMGGLFDAIENQKEPLILFMDEFESLGQKRMNAGLNPGSEHHHNEMINTLLARMEKYDGFMIAATNHHGEIDPALWRRFDIHVELALPGTAEIKSILKRYLKPFVLPDENLQKLADAFHTASPALMRQFCESIKRNIIIGPKAEWDMARDACIERILTTTEPHKDLGKPRLWSQKADDIAITTMPWPLEKSLDAYEQKPTSAIDVEGSNVVTLGTAVGKGG